MAHCPSEDWDRYAKSMDNAADEEMAAENRESPDTIDSEAKLLDMIGAKDREGVKRRVYKDTECGAWIEFDPDGISLGSIVEGCDTGTASYPLKYPFTAADYEAAIEAVEEDADAIWMEYNGCDEGDSDEADE